MDLIFFEDAKKVFELALSCGFLDTEKDSVRFVEDYIYTGTSRNLGIVFIHKKWKFSLYFRPISGRIDKRQLNLTKNRKSLRIYYAHQKMLEAKYGSIQKAMDNLCHHLEANSHEHADKLYYGIYPGGRIDTD